MSRPFVLFPLLVLEGLDNILCYPISTAFKTRQRVVTSCNLLSLPPRMNDFFSLLSLSYSMTYSTIPCLHSVRFSTP
ncbi:hypothetical protein BDZ97DRAFT_1267286 [Flammula alnicola]|nr:hypothetical protein BDZ97DRAFT_1267286 [Flammula alnicola]